MRDPKLDLAFAKVMRRIKTETGSTYGEIASDAGVNSVTVRNYCARAPDSVHVIYSMMQFFGDGLAEFFKQVEEELEAGSKPRTKTNKGGRPKSSETEKRNQAILAMRKGGASLDEIQKKFGIGCRKYIYQILRETRKAVQ